MADTQNVPLVVDLDGTVIRTDMMWESLARLLRRNPLAIFQILFWWSRGRAHLKKQLVARVQIDPAPLPYHTEFLGWLRKEKASGRKIILATASDREMARPIAEHLGLFDEVMASDGKTNLRCENKRLALVEKFGERGFDYAGNSQDDLMVWPSAREAVVVNASPEVLREAGKVTTLGPSFCAGYTTYEPQKRFVVELFWRSGYVAAMIAGLLLALAFPKFSIAGFAWIAPALMLAAASGKSGGDSFRVGYVAGLAFWLASLYWLLLMPAPVYSVVLGWVALSGYTALFSGAWVWLVTMFSPGMNGLLDKWINGQTRQSTLSQDTWAGRAAWALTGAAAWVALEMLRERLLGGFPWSFLGVSQYKLTPLIQISAVTGVYGVSFLVVWLSLALYSAARMIAQQPARRHVWQGEIALPMVAVLACYIVGYFSMAGTTPAENSLRVTAVQPSVPQTLIWDPAEDRHRFAELLEMSHHALTNQSEAGDLLVWPESAVPDIDDPTYEAINEFVQSNHVWLILNGEDVDLNPSATNFYNAAFLVGPDGKWRQVYHKRDLVIFGEYVPLEKWLPFLKWLTPITGGWTSGDKPVTFELERHASGPHVLELQNSQLVPEGGASTIVRCSPLICFEDTFPDSARDSAQDDTDFLVNLTNDGWFGQSAEQWQHMADSVFRAVENGLPLLRCCNNGITCLIDGHGRLKEVFRDSKSSEYSPGAMTIEIPLPDKSQPPGRTFYNRHGDCFGWGCVALTALMLVRNALLGRRSK
jgi:apolipoprotein N-acyltransferase